MARDLWLATSYPHFVGLEEGPLELQNEEMFLTLLPWLLPVLETADITEGAHILCMHACTLERAVPSPCHHVLGPALHNIRTVLLV